MPDSESERAKYERMWQHDQYRRKAPGESLVEDAINALGMQSGDSVIDFGCGTGRPAAKLQQRGMAVAGADFADNCLDPGVSIPFYRACLWELPQDLSADFGFCTDVMEHIPAYYVCNVLAEIKRTTRRGCYFQIATRPDVMGKLIGETLHMTVHDAERWRSQLAQHWDSVDAQEGKGWMKATVR